MRKRKNPSQLQRIKRKHKRTPKVLNKIFKEELFGLWVGGKTLKAIQNIYADSDKQFTLQHLNHVKSTEGWDERRIEIEKRVEKQTESEIVKVNSKKIRVFNDLVSKALDVVDRDIKRYEDDPENVVENSAKEKKPLPFWYVSEIRELLYLIKIHDEIVNNKSEDSNNLNLNQFNFVNKNQFLTQKTQSKLLDVLSSEQNKSTEEDSE